MRVLILSQEIISQPLALWGYLHLTRAGVSVVTIKLFRIDNVK